MTMKTSIWSLATGLLMFLGIHVQPADAASCFCKFTARPGGNPSPPPVREVLKVAAEGYTQGLEKGKCETYCKGQWAARDKTQLAKLNTQACGNVDLRAYAAIGTAEYQLVNSGSIDVGGVGQWMCPSGQWVHTDNRTCVVGAGCRVPGIPDQSLQGGYFFWKEELYKLAGEAGWTCKR